jgi:WD40 repeat protein
LLATACGDRQLHFWNTRGGSQAGDPLSHGGPVAAVAFNPKGTLLATVASDSMVHIWNWTNGVWQHQPVTFRTTGINDLTFTADGQRLATAASSGEVRLWDPVTGLPCGPPHRMSFYATSVDISPDSRWVAGSSFDGEVRIWPLAPIPQAIDQDMLRLRCWVATGARMDPSGAVGAIAWDRWRQLRQELLENRSQP